MLGQRRLFKLGRLQHARDMPDLGRHAGRRDQNLAGATRDVGVHVRHVHAVAQRRLDARYRIHLLWHGRALAGQRGFVDLQRRRADQASIRWHPVACLDQHDVAGNHLIRRNLEHLAATTHARLDEQHLLQRGDARLSLALLPQRHHGVEQRQAKQHDRCGPLLDARYR